MSEFPGVIMKAPSTLMCTISSHSEELYILEGAIEDWEQDVDGNRVFVPGTYLCRPSNASVHGAPTLRKAPYSAIVRLASWSPDDKDASAVKRPPELVL